jgi:hypothetical protein
MNYIKANLVVDYSEMIQTVIFLSAIRSNHNAVFYGNRKIIVERI